MAGIATAALALLIYIATNDSGVTTVGGVALVVAVVIALLVASGAYLGVDHPKLAAWLLWTWSPGVLLGLGCVSAIAIHLGVEWSAGNDASPQVKATAGALVALVTASVTQIDQWLTKHLSPWLSGVVVLRRYSALFPCVPAGLGPGRKAQEAIERVRRTRTAGGVAKTTAVLTLIRNAIRADQVDGRPNWRCL